VAFGAKQESKQATRHEVLGYQRLRLLSCLDGSRSWTRFEPGPDEDVMMAFREWTARIVREHAGTAGPSPDVTLALLGAARLLSGDLSGADTILENLPEQPYLLDHGAGYCLVQPLHALSTALPLPPHLKDVGRWLASSAEQAALRVWLAQHRGELVWDEPRGVYTLPLPLADAERVQEAILRLARLDRLDLTPALHTLRNEPDANEAAHEVLTSAGAQAVPAIEAALDGASGTGRVALTKALLHIDKQRASVILERLVHDDTPAWVDTCLVGFRSVSDWARHTGSSQPRQGVQPLDLPARPQPRRPVSPTWLWLIALLIIGATWFYWRNGNAG
jgi:alpha-D-ribose 1-methylphosphonate 5-triphosphate synthase subunit PhnH